MDRPTALLFDLDGTLVDSAVTIALALSALSAERGGAPVDVGTARGLVSKGASALVRQSLGEAAGDEAEDLAAFRRILADIPADPAIMFPGVPEALASLAGHPCAVVTNKPAGLARLLLDQLDLSRFFGAVIGGDTLPLCKPHPEPLRYAVAVLQAGRQAMMIGDSPVDARAAAAAAMPFLLYEKGYEAAGCRDLPVFASFAAFDDLPPIIAEASQSLTSAVAGGAMEIMAKPEAT